MSSTQTFLAMQSVSNTNTTRLVSNSLASSFIGNSLPRSFPMKKRVVKISGEVRAAAAVTTSPVEETKEFTLPSWTMFELGKAPVYWKTMNGLPPSSGEKLKIFYNPTATNLVPNEEFGIAFNVNASIITSSTQTFLAMQSVSNTNTTRLVSNSLASSFIGNSLPRSFPMKKRVVKISGEVRAAAAVTTSPVEETKEFTLPSWTMFELGKAPVYWKTMNGLPPSSGEKLKIFYNPTATNLVPNEEFGIAFNGGFNQPIMCGGEPRAMLRKNRGKADRPIYTIQICIPKHAQNLIFSFTNGVDWDGPYKMQFQVPKAWRNKPIDFFNQGLAQELSKEGACDKAIFPDTEIVVTRCDMIGNLTVEGGDRCNLNLIPGCTDPSSPSYNPLANVDDGSCPIDSDSEV
nr:hypothetical protein CFP56_18411 [Quercus suber]